MIIYDSENVCLESFPEEVSLLIKDLYYVYNSFLSRENRQIFIKSLVENRSFLFNLKVEKSSLFPIASYYTDQCNYIMLSNGKISIYWMQFRSFCDGFFLPNLSIFVGRNQESITRRAKRFTKFYDTLEISESYSVIDVAELDGWICNQTSPYHFFYDHAPYIYDYLYESTFLENIITSRAGCYSDLSIILKNIRISLYESIPKNSALGTFQMMIARDNFPEKNYHQKLINDFDRRLVISSLNNYGPILESSFYDGFDFIIWFFEPTPKRFCNNVKDLLRLIEDISIDFLGKGSNVLIVHDGMTSPYYQNDNIDINYSRSGCYETITHCYTEGLDYEKKILLASKADTFIVDGATSSIIPSRILKKKTFCLVDYDYKKNLKGHMHFDSCFCECVRRSFDKDSWIEDSYSIQLDVFKDSFTNFIKDTK